MKIRPLFAAANTPAHAVSGPIEGDIYRPWMDCRGERLRHFVHPCDATGDVVFSLCGSGG